MDKLNNLRAESRESLVNANGNEQYSRGNNLRFVVCHQTMEWIVEHLQLNSAGSAGFWLGEVNAPCRRLRRRMF